MYIWTREMSVHVSEIDAQHKNFIKILNELEGLRTYPKPAVFGSIYRELLAYADYHFNTEEKYFALFDYEFAAEHTAEHRKMRERLEQMSFDYSSGGRNNLDELLAFCAQWMEEHIMKHDMKYVKCFNEHGLI